jgi:septal ring factor EnvC (AmiA/AmiB activator)
VAGEVARVDPGLVQFDAQGRPLAVRYHFIHAMLLEEVQQQHARLAAQSSRLAGQAAALDQQQARLGELRQTLAAQQHLIEQQAADLASERARLAAAQSALAGLAARLARVEAGARPAGQER